MCWIWDLMLSDSQDNARKLQIMFKLDTCLDVTTSRKPSETTAWFQAQHMSRFHFKPQLKRSLCLQIAKWTQGCKPLKRKHSRYNSASFSSERWGYLPWWSCCVVRERGDEESARAGAGARARAGAGTGAGVGVGVGTLQYTFRTLWLELAGVEISKVCKGANKSPLSRECTKSYHRMSQHLQHYQHVHVYIRGKSINYMLWKSYMYICLDTSRYVSLTSLADGRGVSGGPLR